MPTLFRQAALLGGALLLTALAVPAARAQTTTPDNGTPPTTTTPPSTTPPVTPTPPTPVPAPETPPDDGSHHYRFRIGPAVGVYFPESSKTRDRFGNTWFSIGLGLGSINPVRTQGSASLDLNVFYHGRDSNHAFFAPLGVGYRIALAPSQDVIPYAGISGDLNFTDITSNPDNVHNSFQLGVGASEFIGVNFRDSAFLEARYYEFSRVNGFDLGGLSLAAGYRF